MKKKYKKILSIILGITLFTISGCTNNKISLISSVTDDQAYWNIFNHVVTVGENGYYMLVHKSDLHDYIYYMDKDTAKTIPLCGKADCSHNDEECNAYLSSSYNAPQLYYYNEKLYVIKEGDDGLEYLEEIAKDGSGRRDVFEIGEINSAYCLTFHDDSVYVYTRQGSASGYEVNTATIRRRSLDGKEDEIIYSYTDSGAVIYAVKSYGDKLFFIEEKEGRESTEQHSNRTYERKGIFVYDYNTKEVSQLIDDSICDYTIDIENNTIYYYVVDKGLYKKNLNENKAELIYEAENGQTNICQLSFDGKYLYMNNEQYFSFFFERPKQYYLYVMNLSGEILNEIETETTYSTYFGDDEYVFSTSDMIGGTLRYIKKDEITTAKEWTFIKE